MAQTLAGVLGTDVEAQIVGKYRLAHTPWVNHSWHVTLYVTACGLTTSPIPHGSRSFQIDFDFIDHQLIVLTSDGGVARFALARGTERTMKPITLQNYAEGRWVAGSGGMAELRVVDNGIGIPAAALSWHRVTLPKGSMGSTSKLRAVLDEYAAGGSTVGEDLLVACHLTLCPECRARADEADFYRGRAVSIVIGSGPSAANAGHSVSFVVGTRSTEPNRRGSLSTITRPSSVSTSKWSCGPSSAGSIRYTAVSCSASSATGPTTPRWRSTIGSRSRGRGRSRRTSC